MTGHKDAMETNGDLEGVDSEEAGGNWEELAF